MPTLLEQRDTLIAEAKAAAQRAKDAGRNLTTGELSKINEKMDQVHRIDGQVKSAAEGDALFAEIMKVGPGGQHQGGEESGGTTKYLNMSALSRKNLGAQAARTMVGILDGQRSVLPTGESYLPPVLSPTDPVAEGRAEAAVTLLGLIPVTVIPSGDLTKYFRQSSRVSAFKAVAPGESKPVNPYGLTPIDVKLSVYAGLSEPQDRFALDDADQLVEFITAELLWGLWTAVERDIVSGNPAVGAPGIKGITATSGVRAQAFVGDILQTTRQALVGNQTLGYGTGLVFVMSPSDWADAQLLQAQGSGTFLMPGAPNQDPPATLWGFPVAISTALPPKTALLIDRGRLTLYSSPSVKIDTFSPRDLWEKNQVEFRCESRYQLGVLMPAAHVVIATATP